MCVLRLWCKQINNNNKNYFPAGVIPSSVPMKSISHIWYLWFLLPTTMGPVSERKREIWKERKQWNWLLNTDIFDVSLKCAMCQSHEIRFSFAVTSWSTGEWMYYTEGGRHSFCFLITIFQNFGASTPTVRVILCVMRICIHRPLAHVICNKIERYWHEHESRRHINRFGPHGKKKKSAEPRTRR